MEYNNQTVATSDDDSTATENKTLEFAKEVAYDFATTAAASLGVVAGVLTAGFVYQKFLDLRAARRLKKETLLTPVEPLNKS